MHSENHKKPGTWGTLYWGILSANPENFEAHHQMGDNNKLETKKSVPWDALAYA